MVGARERTVQYQQNCSAPCSQEVRLQQDGRCTGKVLATAGGHSRRTRKKLHPPLDFICRLERHSNACTPTTFQRSMQRTRRDSRSTSDAADTCTASADRRKAAAVPPRPLRQCGGEWLGTGSCRTCAASTQKLHCL